MVSQLLKDINDVGNSYTNFKYPWSLLTAFESDKDDQKCDHLKIILRLNKLEKPVVISIYQVELKL